MSRSRYDNLREIARPIHLHGVRTPLEYERLHQQAMGAHRRALPDVTFPDPWSAPNGATAWIAGGKWIVTCECGNAASASPEWDVARCLECGAVYKNIAWPADAPLIENALLVRSANQRAWKTSQTVDDLKTENFNNGLRATF
jgi:hypothetical protein